MKNLKKWLPIALIGFVALFLSGCKVDWSTVSATETNGFAVFLFWVLVHVIIPAALFIGFLVLLDPDDFSLAADFSVGARVILGISLVGLYVFHFFYMKSPWFNLLCLTQLGFLALTFIIYAADEDSLARPIVFSLSSAGFIIVSLLANVITGTYLEPFVFSCASWLAVILGSFGREGRDDGNIGIEILSPILCFTAMIFGLVHASTPHYLYMIAVQCAIAMIFTLPFILAETSVFSFFALILSYVCVFVAAIRYNPESFGKSLAVSLIGWGAILLLLIIVLIISSKIKTKEAAAQAAYNAQKAKERAKKKAEEEATAKIIAEEKAKMKAEAEAKAKQEAEEKAKAEAEAKAKQLAETQQVLTQMENDLEAKKAELASLGLDAQGIVRKAALNKEIKELEPQVETLKAEVERLSK